MDQKLISISAAALALAAVYGTAEAASPGLFHTAAAVIAPAIGMDVAEQREVIAPPSDIDPGMTKVPPATGARMPIVAPPDVPGSRFGIER